MWHFLLDVYTLIFRFLGMPTGFVDIHFNQLFFHIIVYVFNPLIVGEKKSNAIF